MRLAGRIALVSFALAVGAPAARAQVAFQFRGLADGEFWQTDDGSRLLSRNAGYPATLGRLHLWVAGQAGPLFQVAVLTEFESGDARQEDIENDIEASVDQAVLRYSPARLPFVLEGGRITHPVGAFAARRFSNVNPLIGAPDAYGTLYPWGGQASATWGRADFRAALVDLPVVNTKYSPEPSPRVRPALGAGFTPATGIHVGGSFTSGPYLNRSLAPVLPDGSRWDDYWERIYGIDAQLSRGYFELNGELVFSRYEVPDRSALNGVAHYTELKYTWTPRFFTAIRFEQNDYPFILPIAKGFWITNVTNFYDAEAGVGFRVGPETVVKVAYRRDFWTVDQSLRSILPDGYSISTQISHGFDVESLLRAPR